MSPSNPGAGAGNNRSSGGRDRRPRKPGGGQPRAGGRSGQGAGSGKSGGRGGDRYRSRSEQQRSGGQPKPSGGRASGGAPRKYTRGKPRPDRRDEDEGIPGNKQWGGLARKGVLRANQDERQMDERKAELRNEPIDEAAAAKRAERERKRADREQRQATLREQARIAVERANRGSAGKAKPRPPRPKPPLERVPLPGGPARNEDEVEALNRLLGPAEAKKQLRKLRNAAEGFEAERYADARKSLKSIVELAPTVPEVRELYGLTLYRMGQYRAAAKQLEQFRVLAASVDQNPVLADCYRAQGRWADVKELWEELAEVSPGADLVNEGRIVMAGALADQGDIEGAVRFLEKGWKRPSRPHDHHLRRAYALADLYERSGNLPRARALFDWVLKHDADFVDTRRRLRNLR